MVDDEFVIQCSICGARCPLYGPSGFFVHVTHEHPSTPLAQKVAEHLTSHRERPMPWDRSPAGDDGRGTAG